MESMKMELEIKSKVAGVITYVVDNHAHVAAEQTLAVVR
jgi:biotin carboxyl carrier protein